MEFNAEVPVRRDQVHHLLRSLNAAMIAQGYDDALRADLCLIAEEVACNVLEHGVPEHGAQQHGAPERGASKPTDDDAHWLRVGIVRDGPRLHIEFRDTGLAYDPLACPPPDLDADIGERPIGGLGVYLVQALAEDVRYAREEPHNVLRLVVRLPDPGS